MGIATMILTQARNRSGVATMILTHARNRSALIVAPSEVSTLWKEGRIWSHFSIKNTKSTSPPIFLKRGETRFYFYLI